jgi:hypothetical protein
MNEDAAVQAVYTVINNAKDTLVQDITHNGVAREILHLATTNLAPPTAYYAVAVYCERARESAMPGVNTADGVDWAEYDMVVQLGDVANIQPTDTLPYQIAHADFRKFRDRIVKLIRTTKWFPSATASPRLRFPVDAGGVEHKRVDVENQNFSWEEAENVTYAMLFSRITFTLMDHCSDSSLLY